MNRYLPFLGFVAIILALVVLGETGKLRSGSSTGPTTVTTTVMNPSVRPKLVLVGGSICNEDIPDQTFHFQLKDSTPGKNAAIIIVRYPGGKFYSFHKDYGVVTIPGSGNFSSADWACWYGPKGTLDPLSTKQHPYTVIALDLKTGIASKVRTFQVLARMTRG